MKKLKISNEAMKLLRKGFVGNGCGSGIISRILCKISTMFFKEDLSKIWLIHDAEYSISRSLKSRNHKNQADSNAEINIRNTLRITDHNKDKNKFKDIFAKVIHAILVLGGDKAYWDIQTKPSIIKIVIFVVITYSIILRCISEII